MDTPPNNDMDTNSLGLTAFTVFAYILGSITLSSVATIVAIGAGLSTIAYNMYKILKDDK